MMCPACGSLMYPAKLLKGYDKTGPDADRPTCALHGPQGTFRHIATDRKADYQPSVIDDPDAR
jgi:hypothetical protein